MDTSVGLNYTLFKKASLHEDRGIKFNALLLAHFFFAKNENKKEGGK